MKLAYSHLKLKILKKDYQYTLFESGENSSLIFSSIKFSHYPFAAFISEQEFSLIAPTELIFPITPIKIEPGWSCFQIVGTMPFGTVQGLIANISNILIIEKIGVCIVSTFKSDWFFVKNKYQIQAINLLTKSGWNVEKE